MLLPMDFDFAAMGWGLAEYFPQGYTNLFHLEKIHLAAPNDAPNAEISQDRRTEIRIKGPSGFNDRPSGQSSDGERERYLVLREPIECRSSGDVIGKRFSLQGAVNMADRYAQKYGRRALVARILAVLTWH